MRAAILLAYCVVATIGQAQDWALINPAYKYNYSNDGTDTIRHQVKVMNTEALGPEISVFQLNRTAEFCLWCGENCDLHLGLTQFMQGSCTAVGTNWQFTFPAALEIRARAALYEQWTLDQQNATLATLTSVAETMTFGLADSARTMVSELGDTVVWSKNFGILLWHLHGDTRYELIGVHGPDVGAAVPSVSDFIPFQAGDVVQMSTTSYELNHNASWRKVYRRFHIEERLETMDHIRFTGYAWDITQNYLPQFIHPHHGPYVWEIDLGNDATLAPMNTAPGEFVGFRDQQWSYSNVQMVARHRRDQHGHYVIESVPGYVNGTGMFTGVDPLADGCMMVDPCYSYNNYRLDTELGMRVIPLCSYGSHRIFRTDGAVIAGDTIGTVHSDSFMQIPLPEIQYPVVPQGLFPNPTNEAFSLQDTISNASIDILGIDQRLIRSIKLQGTNTSVPVGDLPPGTYVVIVSGLPPQRLVIAR